MHNLEFRGRWLDIFGNVLLIAVLTIITLGIYAPWGYARFKRVIASHTYYQDKPLQFDGSGIQALVEFLIIALYSLITLGLYAILGFASTRLLRWEYAHTILPTGQRLDYRGDAIDLFFENFLMIFFSILTLGIFAFWGYVNVRRYILSHTYLEGKPFAFEGTGGQFFVIWLVNTLLTIITLGFYQLLGFALVRQLQWEARSTLVPSPERATRPMPVHSPTVNALTGGPMVERSRTLSQPRDLFPTPPPQRYEEESDYTTRPDVYGAGEERGYSPQGGYAEQPDTPYDPRYDTQYRDQYGQPYNPPYEGQTDDRYRDQYGNRYRPQDEQYSEPEQDRYTPTDRYPTNQTQPDPYRRYNPDEYNESEQYPTDYRRPRGDADDRDEKGYRPR